MKKIYFTLLLMALPAAMFAQLKVNSDGNASIGLNTPYPNTFFSIGNVESSSSVGNVSLYARLKSSYLESGMTNVGVFGRMQCNGYDTKAVGAWGHIATGPSGKNFGVVGSVVSGLTGIGVYGTVSSSGPLTGNAVTGSYAGYFVGPTYVDGTLTATSVITPSDMTIKENVVPVKEEEIKNGTVLDNLMNLDVIKYTYKEKKYVKTAEEAELYEDEETASKAEEVTRQQILKAAQQKHYGLSAQELQKIYPDLVHKNQEGILGINYVELVPVLLRSIQELKEKIDNLEGNASPNAMSRGTASAITASSTTTGNVLYQNTPNPFKERTVIRFSLADDVTSASVCIFDMTGKMLKKLPVSSGETSVSINGWELGEGMFLYTLIANGKEIDTKRMIITK